MGLDVAARHRHKAARKKSSKDDGENQRGCAQSLAGGRAATQKARQAVDSTPCGAPRIICGQWAGAASAEESASSWPKRCSLVGRAKYTEDL